MSSPEHDFNPATEQPIGSDGEKFYEPPPRVQEVINSNGDEIMAYLRTLNLSDEMLAKIEQPTHGGYEDAMEAIREAIGTQKGVITWLNTQKEALNKLLEIRRCRLAEAFGLDSDEAVNQALEKRDAELAGGFSLLRRAIDSLRGEISDVNLVDEVLSLNLDRTLADYDRLSNRVGELDTKIERARSGNLDTIELIQERMEQLRGSTPKILGNPPEDLSQQ